MRVLAWNVNGIRAHSLSVAQILQKLNADVVCFQETKITRDMLDTPTAIIEGYTSYYSFCKTKSGYSGVATYCRDSILPTNALDSLQDSKDDLGRIGRDEMLEYFREKETSKDSDEKYLEALDCEGRALLTEHTVSYGDECKSLVIINLYCPRVDPDKPGRQTYQTDFHKLVQIKTEALIESGRHVVVIGDLNVSHRRMDHCKPEENPDFEKRPSRLWLNQFLHDLHHPKFTTCDNPHCTCGLPRSQETDHSNELDDDVILIEAESEQRNKKHSKAKRGQKSGSKIVSEKKESDIERNGKIMVDLFRYYHPSRKNGYTCWNTATGARQMNYGTRLDYVICDIDLPTKSCDISPEVEGSDHCPIFADFDVNCIASDRTPKCCTKFFPELIGKQCKISDFFKKGKIESDSKSQETGLSPGSNRPEKRPSKSKKISVSKKPKLTTSSSGDGTLFQAFGLKRTTSDPQRQVKKLDDERTASQSSSTSVTQSMDKRVNIESNFEDLRSLEAPKSTAMAAGWGALFKQPDKPNCKGHNKPCVLRKTKKDTVNKGREFWTCAKPEGPKNNPDSRCEHFEWVTPKSKLKSSKS